MKCSTLKYLARLEEERSGTVEKSADYLVEFLKEQCKPYFSSYRDTITNLKTHIMLWAMLKELTLS
jgi:hypothetical protein